jgi:LysR family glycine cleavage system transcriptional activator
MNPRLPSLNGLKAFEAAARQRSFTRAAVELGVTQTAVSHQIKRLEEQLGRPLFVWRNRTLGLTETGTAYLPAVRAAFDQLREATERLRHADEKGVLTVSTLASFAVKWLVPRLGGFQAQNPEIDVRISTSLALVDFAREDVDIAIRYGRGRWPGVQSSYLVKEDCVPVCSPALADGDPPLRRPEDLKRHTLLRVTGYDDQWRMWLTAAGVSGVEPSRGPMFDDDLAALEAAIRGLGVALIGAPIAEGDLSAGRLVTPFALALPDDAAYYVVAPAEGPERPKVKRFRDWLLAAVAEKPEPVPSHRRRRRGGR